MNGILKALLHYTEQKQNKFGSFAIDIKREKKEDDDLDEVEERYTNPLTEHQICREEINRYFYDKAAGTFNFVRRDIPYQKKKTNIMG